MINWPAADRMSKTAAGILERFKKTSAAKDLEQDSRAWSFVSWSWLPDPPYTLVLRTPDFEERYFVMESDGRWQMRITRQAGQNLFSSSSEA